MENTYSNPKKLYWLADMECNVCAGEVNSWDKRCSRALGYKQIVCETDNFNFQYLQHHKIRAVAFLLRPYQPHIQLARFFRFICNTLIAWYR